MKAHVTENVEVRTILRQAIKDNDGYCVSVSDAKGNLLYLCPCEDFIKNTEAGETCRCGLYVKDE